MPAGIPLSVIAVQTVPPLLPAPRVTYQPSDLPALPKEMDTFEPPVEKQVPAAAAPAFGEWSRRIRPGETLIGFGANLPRSNAGTYRVFGQTTVNRAVDRRVTLMNSEGDRRAMIDMPTGLPTDSAYFVWAQNAAGWSYPAVVNTAESWWVGPENATPGDYVHLYGQNLMRRGRSASIYLKPAGRRGQWVYADGTDGFRCRFQIPRTMATGTIEVFAHNGSGGKYGWSKPQKLNIVAPTEWNTPFLNVKSFGATPNDATDDEAAIQAAFEAARSKPWSTVYFPRGKYYAGRGFSVPEKTRVMGDGMGASIIAVHPNFVKPPEYDGRRYALFFENGNDVRFESISLAEEGNLNGILGVLFYARFKSRLSFENFSIDAGLKNGFDLHGSDDLRFTECDIISAGSFLGTARQVHFTRVNFLGTNDANELIGSWGGRQISFQSCYGRSLSDSDSSRPDGWAQGRFVVFQGHWGSVEDVYFGNNTTVKMGPRPGFGNQNTGEQFLLEMPATTFSGPPNMVKGNTLQFRKLVGGELPGTTLFVADGPGEGQVRRIVGFDSNTGTVTLDETLWVRPTAASDIRIGRMADRIAVCGNRFSGRPEHVSQEDHVAVTGVYAQGTMRLVMDSNYLRDMRGSFSGFGALALPATSPRDAMPNVWVDVRDNWSTNTRSGFASLAIDWSQTGVADRGPATVANAFRGNRIYEGFETAFSVSDEWSAANPIRNVLIERNQIQAPNPFWLNLGGPARPSSVLVRNNVILP